MTTTTRPVWAPARCPLPLALEIARRCGLVLENAQLYREARDAVHALEGFLSMASHDLRTPLTALQLNLDGLARRIERGDALVQGHLLDRIRAAGRQVQRLGAMVSNLLDVSRMTAGRLPLELEEVDLATVVRDVVGRHAEEAVRANCDVTVDAAAPVVGRWDRVRLDQVVTNLLSNALKYGAGRPVELTVEARGAGALLFVRDQGVGIEPADQRRIFERFERGTTVQAVDGVGLGLWIVRQITEALGGAVSVTSQPGQGAVFTVELPR